MQASAEHRVTAVLLVAIILALALRCLNGHCSAPGDIVLAHPDGNGGRGIGHGHHVTRGVR